MKKIKLLFLIAIVLMCTGCTIEYNINITKDNIEEIINVQDNITKNRTRNDILNHYNQWYPTFVNYIPEAMETIELEDFNLKVDWIEYHEKTIKEVKDGYNYTYKYTYDIDDYHDAYSIARTYTDTTVLKTTDNLVLRTGKKNNLCQYTYFNELKVNITIDPKVYKLNNTNTTKINNNTYTWIFDKNDCNDSQIILTLEKIDSNQEDSTTQDGNIKNKKRDYTMYIFCGILIVLILIGCTIFNKIKNKNNNFDIDD